MACINRKGSAKDNCNNITRLIWLWCLERDIKLVAVHLPGKMNVEADRESRKKRYPEWFLNKKVFQELNKTMGPFDIDLFASRTAHQLDKYVSWKPDPGAWHTDAMSLDWNAIGDGLYCFPPTCMLSLILSRVQQQKATMTIIAPQWPQQVWYPTLLGMLIDSPVILPKIKDIVSDPATGKIMSNAKLRLVAYKVSGDCSRVRTFQKKLGTLFVRGGEITPRRLTMYL